MTGTDRVCTCGAVAANNAEALAYLGYVHRRQGQLERSLEELTKAIEPGPRNASLAENRADIYSRPGSGQRQGLRSELPSRSIRMKSSHARAAPQRVNGSGIARRTECSRVIRPTSKLIVNSNVGDVTGVTGERAYMFVLARDYTTALNVWNDARGLPLTSGGSSLREWPFESSLASLPARKRTQKQARLAARATGPRSAQEFLPTPELAWVLSRPET